MGKERNAFIRRKSFKGKLENERDKVKSNRSILKSGSGSAQFPKLKWRKSGVCWRSVPQGIATHRIREFQGLDLGHVLQEIQSRPAEHVKLELLQIG